MRDGVCQWDGEGCNITVTIGGDWGGCGAFSAKPAAGGPTGRAADKFYLYNRPLAKLSKAVKVADTGNQGKAESKALSAVTVTLREDTESFKKTDGVFNKDTFS